MTKGEYSIMQAKGDFKTSFFVNGLVISLIKTKCLCIFKLDLFKYEFAEILLYYTNIKILSLKCVSRNGNVSIAITLQRIHGPLKWSSCLHIEMSDNNAQISFRVHLLLSSYIKLKSYNFQKQLWLNVRK